MIITLSISFPDDFFEQLEEAILRGEVVVDDVDEEMRVVDLVEDLLGGFVLVVETSPLFQPQSERLVFPNSERYWIDDCWLCDFPSGKHSPRDHDGFDGVAVGHVEAAVVIDDVEIHRRISSQSLQQLFLVFPGNEEFQISLLEDETVFAAPAEDLIIRGNGVGIWLRVDGE